jgi:hypothetical protein
MIEVFLDWNRFMEISAEAGSHHYDFDTGLAYLKSWCEDRCRFFWTAQRGHAGGPDKGPVGFLFRFYHDSDALMFKLTWG